MFTSSDYTTVLSNPTYNFGETVYMIAKMKEETVMDRTIIPEYIHVYKGSDSEPLHKVTIEDFIVDRPFDTADLYANWDADKR